jgi:hypothetical protein
MARCCALLLSMTEPKNRGQASTGNLLIDSARLESLLSSSISQVDISTEMHLTTIGWAGESDPPQCGFLNRIALLSKTGTSPPLTVSTCMSEPVLHK